MGTNVERQSESRRNAATQCANYSKSNLHSKSEVDVNEDADFPTLRYKKEEGSVSLTEHD